MDLHDLQGVLGKSSERSSKSVAVILQRMSSRMDGAREYNLAYAPIWSLAATERFLRRDGLHPQALNAAMQAVKIVYPIGDRYGLNTGTREIEQLAQASGLFLQALSRTSGIASSSPAKFHLLMEHCYCKLLASTLERDADKRRDLLHSLGKEYQELLQHHPNSAIVHFRYSIVLGELDRHDESFSAVKQAMKCLAADSYISHEHWISSTIVRRMAYHFARQAHEVYERLKTNPTDEALALQYRTHVREAFLTIFEGFDEQRSADNLLAGLESQRRLNNIVYYASLYVEVHGDPRDLAPGFDEERLLELVRKLHPHGIARVDAWNVLHTIGYAYHAMNRHDDASEAADALWNLIARIGTSTQSVGIRNALDDALTWKKQGALSVRATVF
jgi:tetratricopeptide (TPR) repeat protein